MASSSTPIHTCRTSNCTGHTRVSSSVFPVTTGELYRAIEHGYLRWTTFEELKSTLLQLKGAQVENNCFKLTNCCGEVDQVARILISGLQVPMSKCSIEMRFAYLAIANTVRAFANEEDASKLANAEKVYLRFEVGDDYVSKERFEEVRPYLSEEQIKIIKKDQDVEESMWPSTLPVQRGQNIVEIMHTAPIVHAAMQVDEIAALPPGILPLIVSYLPGPLDG